MRIGLVVTLGLPALASAQTTFPAPTAPQPAVQLPPASSAVVTHLLRVLEKREQNSSPWLGSLAAAAAFSPEAHDAQTQLRALGSRAASAAPRVAELLVRTERNGYDLGWTLWSVSLQPGTEALPALREASVDTASTLPLRLEALAQIGRTRSALALPMLRDASASADTAQRLVAAIALGHQAEAAAGEEPAKLLALMLKDKEKPVRSAAVNGLRMLGARNRAATPALIDYLQTRDNVYMATQALQAAPVRDVMPAQAELESILIDPKLTDFQKQPTVALLLRIEQQRGLDASAVPAPRPPVPRPAVPVPVRPVDDMNRT